MSGTQAGAAVIARAVPADLAALSEFFAGLSLRTRYQRFFAAVTPTPAMLRTLSGSSGRAEALVAVRAGVIVGHAMAADQPGLDGTVVTDIGVVVADAWQGHGVGGALIRAVITAAAERGVAALTMDVQHSNRRVLAMIASHWPDACTSRATDGILIKVGLPRRPDAGPAVQPAVPCLVSVPGAASHGLAVPAGARSRRTGQ